MKQYILFFIASLFFIKVNAQNRGQVEVMKFISEEKDTILIYADDIKISNEQSFEIVDNGKVDKLKEMNIEEVFFVCNCCGDNKVSLHNILSSSAPSSNLYILVLGRNKIHFINKSFIECSEILIQKLKKRIQ